MRIGIIVNTLYTVPPESYGGVESCVYRLIKGLSKKGHDVVFFGKSGSETDASSQVLVQHDELSFKVLSEKATKIRDTLDVVSDHTQQKEFVRKNPDFPHIIMNHGDPTGELTANNPSSNMVFGSRALARHVNMPNHPVVYEDIADNPDEIPFWGEYTTDRLIYMGDVSVGKGVLTAIDVAKTQNLRLELAGPISDEMREVVAEHDHVKYVGCVSRAGKDKWDFLGGAIAFLHLSELNDASPSAPRESILTGTPVIAYRDGGLPELIQHEVNGYLCDRDTVGNYVQQCILCCVNRRLARKSVMEKFNNDSMVEGYLKVYTEAINGGTW